MSNVVAFPRSRAPRQPQTGCAKTLFLQIRRTTLIIHAGKAANIAPSKTERVNQR